MGDNALEKEIVRTRFARAELGESPRFDAETQTVSWVDLVAGRLWLAHAAPDDPVAAWEPEAEPLIEVPGPLGCAVRTTSGGWLLASGGTVFHWRAGTAPTPLAVLEPDTDTARLNDGAVDAEGRFWVGSMSVPRPLKPWGRLHVLDHEGTSVGGRVVRAGMLAANGIAWSPDGSTCYAVDSGHRLIHRVKAASGELLGPAGPPLSVPAGVPDGITVDDEGCLWVALWDAAAVVRLNPQGQVLQRVTMPCSRPTSCALLGSRLVICTATLPGEAASGWTYTVEVAVGGPAAHRAQIPGEPTA
ncbi:SMP-30/gluconolactonase/LRE family protein [Streptomyces sp. NPDC058665]|uniref:SMP-30/gluconolactonase/LRE family protein n=1 Tax=Streptomyces sp. NPDC058665 TaxID=3346586 RepID=UPI00364DC7D3